MDSFVHRENLAHYRRLLAEPDVADDQVRYQTLVRLLAEETAKETASDAETTPTQSGPRCRSVAQ
ncbi:hypothetical protein [Bradyrhizobium sp.]|uniref:hypothetical protein n=1 Tax=Bradyrhizobium sp. TaxID=376 RepID=UPI0025C4EF82|nr:hypothetical protein [Bradyrhizobium sp.]